MSGSLAEVTLRTESWRFVPSASATVDQSTFTLVLETVLEPFTGERILYTLPGVLTVRLRQHDPADRSRQNYPACPLPDGSVPVLEATLTVHSDEHPDWREQTIGVPLGTLAPPWARHEVVLHYSGVHWSLYIDGVLVDNDYPFGALRWPDGSIAGQVASGVTDTLHRPCLRPERVAALVPQRVAMPYWTPPGHNTWVGDVVTCYHQGRYHVFYLYDRRHHGSKFGQGAHYFEHLSTANLLDWTEHEAATPLEAPWECIGTGTPFVYDGKLHLSYGLHTERIYPDGRADVPVGASYAVSADGVTAFAKSGVIFHSCRNPSVYIDPAGALRMIANYQARGFWESERLDSGWHCVQPAFPPGGDCTFFFRWGAFDYIVGGFTQLWAKPAAAPDTAYDDWASQGLDFYDGLNVPSATVLPDGRCLLAGWIAIRGWGGPLVIRELLQYPDGRLGIRWLPELLPATGPAQPLSGARGTVPAPAFLLTATVRPETLGAGRVALVLGDGCQLQLDLAARRAQFSLPTATGFAPPEKTLAEGGNPAAGGDYAVANLLGLDGAFALRVLVMTNAKLGGSVIDVELAGCRTLLTYRPERVVTEIEWRTEGVALEAVEVAPLVFA